MIRSSLNLMILLTAWITIFSLTSSVSGRGTFTHNETKSFSTSPRIWQYGTYFDGTVVLRIVNKNPNKTSSSDEVWIRPVLSLRIIHPNGTVSEIDKDLEIPEFNWRITISLGPVNIYALQKGYLLVTYFNTSNPNDINTYEEWGRIIDWNGNLYDKVNFSKAYTENGTWYPSDTTIVTNIDPEKGFIRIAGDAFNLKKLSEGNITIFQTDVFNVIATVDEGYSIIIGYSTYSSNNNPLEIRAAVYALTKRYDDKQFGAPKMIYHLPLDNITITDIFAGTSSTGIGQ
ncbi:4297_t:CDS:2, partial [Diversispora eburnea]